MTLLTVFSAPKPFTDPHIALIQRKLERFLEDQGVTVIEAEGQPSRPARIPPVAP